MEAKRYAEVAAALFLAQAAFAIVHRISGAEYRHFVHLQNVIIDVGLATIWIAGAIACFTRRSKAAFLAVIAAVLVTFMHGIMFSLAAPGKGYGVPFLVSSALLSLLLARSARAWSSAATPSAARQEIHAALPRPRHA